MAQSNLENQEQYVLSVVEQLKGLSITESKIILNEAKKHIENETKV